MFTHSEIFEKNYNHYCSQLSTIDFTLVKDTLGIDHDGDRLIIPFFNRQYHVSKNGITDASGNRPDYVVCVILAKYILLCPDTMHHDTEWVSFKDFKRTSHFTNVNYFASDTEQAIETHFTGRLEDLMKAGEKIGGVQNEMNMSYDLGIRFNALPRISLLLLFNDRDEEFPAKCTVLFQKHAEFYLDPESLGVTGAFLAKSLKAAG